MRNEHRPVQRVTSSRKDGKSARGQVRTPPRPTSFYPSPSSPLERPHIPTAVHSEPQRRAGANKARPDNPESPPKPRHRRASTKNRDVIELEESPPPLAQAPAVEQRHTGRVRVKEEELPAAAFLQPVHDERPYAAHERAVTRRSQPTPPSALAREPPDPIIDFLARSCTPGLAGPTLETAIGIFRSNGVQSRDELRVLSSLAKSAKDFWFTQARADGLSMLWECVIRDGLDRLAAGRPAEGP